MASHKQGNLLIRKGMFFMAKTIYQIYDKVFKKILTLSSRAVINMINGLFLTEYPPDSTIHYNWTEFQEDGNIDSISTIETAGQAGEIPYKRGSGSIEKSHSGEYNPVFDSFKEKKSLQPL